ncbi:DNA polymerase II large subunit [Candidatus Woesearchaeota archaeon]|nr:DNA polymerase II large subunit [Candidatus Woesearchaeota archaeon]
MNATITMQQYFDKIEKEVNTAYVLATSVRKKNKDPTNTVEISLAKNMAERVVGLISIIAPQIVNSGVVERIIELEKQYTPLDWRVALKIAEEVAQQKFCTFKSKQEAIDVGIRTGFAYVTVGVVSSPLDGIVSIDIKKRIDGRGEYFCINFAGPIRNAGGTAAAVSLIIADYIRTIFGYDVYDPTEDEIKRAMTEMQDYRDKVAPRQYFPSWEEHEFAMTHIPVEVGGEPSEQIEVSNYKNLPRIPTDFIRSGFALIMTECIPLKAPKLWKQISNWGKEFKLDQWFFLEEFLKIQKKQKAKGQAKKEGTSITPDYTFLHDLVAGRPVFSHPLRHGGLRLRYGRCRTSGFSSCCIHPASMYIMNSYLATGTQIKIERPSKGSAITASDLIEGPVIKLKNGSVTILDTLQKAKDTIENVSEILYFGDFLVSYGDFFNRAHPLVPAGYCEEWWAKELEKKIQSEQSSEGHREGATEQTTNIQNISHEQLQQLINKPLQTQITTEQAINISKILNIPLHPKYTYHWLAITQQQLITLINWLSTAQINENKQLIIKTEPEAKRLLELIAAPHTVINQETIIEQDCAIAILTTTGLADKTKEQIISTIESQKEKSTLDILKQISGITIRDKGGTFIGARMGRPEKAKMRKLTGSPHVLFPVGDEGGKYRCFQSALEKGKILADFPKYNCPTCKKDTVYKTCDNCDSPTIKQYYCKKCGWIEQQTCAQHGNTTTHLEREIDIPHIFSTTIKKINMKTYPDLIKGVRGTSNKEHIPEHLGKGILRAKHDIYVNKDGTTRYDMTQLPITHFKPKEIGTNIEKLKELGYEKDMHSQPLIEDDQILELKPQDVILPGYDQFTEESASKILYRVAHFVDDILVNLYDEKPFYNFKTEQDSIGHIVVCLAPHTSAAITGRIVGYSKTQGFFAHPLLHAATRRDCDGDEACVILLMDALINFSRQYLPNTRGATMDAPLVLTTLLTPAEVDDMAFDLDIDWQYPLELYEAATEYKMPWEIKIKQLKSTLHTPKQYEGMGFTHDVTDMNAVVRCSAYKMLPSMEEKLKGQMDIAEKLRPVDTSDVARLIIEKHFLKDTKGNLRKFSTQEFRCVNCNEKYRRPPLIGNCTKCKGKIIFTIAEGSVLKYLEPTISLARKYAVSSYLQQTLDLLQQQVESVFGKEKEKQTGLGAWFG